MSKAQIPGQLDLLTMSRLLAEIGGVTHDGAGGDMAGKTGIGILAQRYVQGRGKRGELAAGSVEKAHYTLLSFVGVAGWDTAPDKLRSRHVEKWLARKPLSDATRRCQLSHVRGFCQWLVLNGYARLDPTLRVPTPRQPRYLPRGVQHQQVMDTYAACPDSRAELIITLDVQMGLRACEVCGLQLGDIDPVQRLMLIRGKGGHERVLPITAETWEAMGRYLDEHPATAGPLVRSYLHPHRGISAAYVSRLVGGWMRDAGVNATGHALRHTAATDMLRAGAHVRDVQRALGHASLATTQRYMPWLVGDLREAMEGRTYRRPAKPVLVASRETPRREASGEAG